VSYGARLLVCAGLSALAHALLARGAARLPELAPPPPRAIVKVRVVAPPPPPPPPPEPEPPRVAEAPAPVPRPRPARVASTPPSAKPAPPTERPAPAPAPAAPAFGVSMESTSQAGTGPSVPIGDTVQLAPPAAPAPAARRDALSPVPAYEVTRMPVPRGRCSGRYTDAARQAGIEGTVVLDLVVGADGRTSDITVASGLDHGLTEAAIAAVEACRFTPGERAGVPVPVRVRGFKIHFLLNGDD
jgi:protein TonB